MSLDKKTKGESRICINISEDTNNWNQEGIELVNKGKKEIPYVPNLEKSRICLNVSQSTLDWNQRAIELARKNYNSGNY